MQVGTAIVRLALCCCLPAVAVVGIAGGNRGMLAMCCEVLCLAWLFNWLVGR